MPDRRSTPPGKPLTEYRQTIVMRLLVSIFLAPFGLLALFGTNHDGFDGWLVVGLLLCAITALVWANGIMFRLRVYPDSLVRKNLFGTTTVALTGRTKFYHKNLQEYVNGVMAGYHIFITVNDGKSKLKLNSNLKNIHALQEWLMEVELKCFYDGRYREYLRGKPVDFGIVRLHRGKLLYKDKSILLSGIKDAKVENGVFKVTAHGKMLSFCKVPISKLANMTTFFRMLDDARANVQVRPEPASPTEVAVLQPPLAQAEPTDALRQPLRETQAEPLPVNMTCPTCEKEMFKRRATTGPHAGKVFWVCSAYPGCKGVVPATE